jgi:hypothetical protein
MSLSNNFPTVSPTLNLNFAAAGRLDSRVTFTRSSTATYTNQIGLIQSAAVNEPRFDYDPSTLAARGLLVEEQRTNLVTYSEDFSNAAWLKSGGGGGSAPVVTANAATAPDGTVTADQVVFVAPVSGDESIIYQSPSTSAGTYTGSFYVKAASGSDVGKVIGFRHVQGGSYLLVTLTNSWVRITLTEARFTDNFEIILRPAVGTSSGTVTAYIWGAQLEQGSFSTSYIPTVAASVTRSADVASVDTLSPWFNATEGTLFAESVSYNNLPVPASLANSGSMDTIALGAVGNNIGRLYIYTSGVEQANLSAAFSGSTLKEAAAYKTNDAQYCANGTLSSQDTSVTLPTLNKMDIGYFTITGAYYQNGWIRRIAYYSARLTNAQLQALTL